MYVTRRLLRSTIPDEPTPEKEEPFLPLATPKRRAAVRASAKICEVVADSSGPAARSRTAKTSPRQTENGGDGKNKNHILKKTKKEKTLKQQEEEAPAVDSAAFHGYQLMVDVHYRGEQYTEARILDLDPDKRLLFVHYMGWNARFDEWVSSDEVAAHGSHSGAAKKSAGWDGETPLFATSEEAAAHKLKGRSKPKKRPAMPSKAQKAARKALRSVSSDRKRQSDEVAEAEDAQAPAKRVVRKSPKNAKAAKSLAKSPRAKKGSTKIVSSPAQRTPRRVQVAVGTTDENSERNNDDQTADLVLEVEVEGREVSNDGIDEAFIEEAEEEEEGASSGRNKKRTAKSKSKKRNRRAAGDAKRKRDESDEDVEEVSTGVKRSPANKSKKSKKAGAGGKAASKAASKPAANTKTTPIPPQSRRGGLGSATREKLAAIFRLRVQQRQQMEEMNASQASFQQSLQDPADDSATATADTASASAGETKSENAAVANTELAAAEEYQRQLQQYYYHQQVMLANSMQVANNLAMNASGCEDPSTIPLQGGIMDPRIIQERLTALEERRRQQAHVQAYYQQLMLTRERNVRALAANQAFMAASAAVWEQQLRETQSEDGAASVTSWKDVTGADSSETGKAEVESSKGDSDSPRQSEARPAVDATRATSPDTVEKATESTASSETSPAKSVSAKCDPAVGTPGESVLYEYVL